MYVVDLKSLFIAVLETQTYSESVPAICSRLALFQPNGWCAGNECWWVHILYYMAIVYPGGE